MREPVEGVIAEGQYGYTVDDRPHGSEMWRIARIDTGGLHIQALLGSGQQILYGMDLLTQAQGAVESVTIQVPPRDSQAAPQRLGLHFTPGAVRGEIASATGRQPIDLALPTGTLPYLAAIATRLLLGGGIDLTIADEQILALCVIPIPMTPPTAPTVVQATATVLGTEPVDLLMATVEATHVIIEWAGHPPQHAWFDERRMPVRWYWVDIAADGTTTAHDFSLTRSTWHP